MKSYSVENCAHASNCGQGGELCPSKSTAGRLLTSPKDENKVVRKINRHLENIMLERLYVSLDNVQSYIY